MRRQFARRSAAALALLLGLALATWYRHSPTDGAPRRAPSLVAAEAEASALSTGTSSRFARVPHPSITMAPAQRDSLQGTDVDGAVNLDSRGRVLADRDLRRLFDYFLTRLGERPLHELRAGLSAWLQSRSELTTDVGAEVLALFDRYVSTQERVAALGRSDDLGDDLTAIAALRRQELGADLAHAWFGAEEDHAQQTLQRLALERNATLLPAERDAAWAALDAGRDPGDRAQQMAATDFQIAVTQSEQLDHAGADAIERERARAELWGEQAALRLAELDRQEADWNERLVAYARARARLLTDSSLSDALRARRLNELLAGFSEPERRRVLALTVAGLLPST